MSAAPLDLTDWFRPLSLAQFTRNVLGHRPLHVEPRAGFAKDVLATLGLASVDDVLASVDAEVHAWMRGLDGRQIAARIPRESARRFHDAGTTLYFRHINDFVDHERAIARVFGVPQASIGCELFCNRLGAGTPGHFDPVDIITVQLTGRKTWRIAPNEFAPLPLEPWALREPVSADLRAYAPQPPPETMPEQSATYQLEPGALLYLPRGYWHETSSDEDSLSLHVMIQPPTRLDLVLAALKQELITQRRWRESVYHADVPEADSLNRVAADLLDLRDAAARLDPRDLVRAEPPDLPIERDTGFQRCGQASLGIERDRLDAATARVTIAAYGLRQTRTTTLELSTEFIPACHWIGALPTGARVAPSDLVRAAPRLAIHEAQDLLRLLESIHLVRRSIDDAVHDPAQKGTAR